MHVKRFNEKKTYKTTIIITELEQMKHFHLDKMYKGDLKKIFDDYKQTIDEIQEEHGDEFYLPIETAGFCTEVSIIGKNFELAEKIAQRLYNKMKSFHETFIVKICIGYGDMINIAERLHMSNGPVFWKVGRTLDKIKKDGIRILKDEITE
jgi:hypothetical protein